MFEMINDHLSSSFSYRKLSIVSPLSLIISFKYPDQGSPPTLGGKGKRFSLKDYKRVNAWCWKANMRNESFKRCGAHPIEKIKVSKSKKRNVEKGKGEQREINNQRKRDKWKHNENDLSWNYPWLRSPWNTIWAYLSFLSEPRTQAYITYLKSPFWLNLDTWTEEFSSLRNFSQSTRLLSLFFSQNSW